MLLTIRQCPGQSLLQNVDSAEAEKPCFNATHNLAQLQRVPSVKSLEVNTWREGWSSSVFIRNQRPGSPSGAEEEAPPFSGRQSLALPPPALWAER